MFMPDSLKIIYSEITGCFCSLQDISLVHDENVSRKPDHGRRNSKGNRPAKIIRFFSRPLLRDLGVEYSNKTFKTIE